MKTKISKQKSEGQQCIPPFILGFAVALLLIFIPMISGYFWVCGHVEVDIENNSSCPRLVRHSSSKHIPIATGWRKWLGPSRQQVEDEFIVIKQDPVECACRLVLDVWSIVTSNRPKSHVATCTPEIVDSDDIDTSLLTAVAHDQFHTAYTPELLQLTSDEKSLVIMLGERVEGKVENWRSRAAQVSWGGTGPPWFAPKKLDGTTALESIDGGLLFYSYLRIMKWPKQLFSHFPFKLCAKGCDSDMALQHTLEFREKFKPWLVSPSTITENSNGCVFHHGFSPPFSENEKGSHSLVWIRPGRRVKVDDIFSTRAYVNVLERAVAASLEHSHGRVGKFNVVVDGHDFSWGLMPSLHQLKVFITILQDHFPDRLGIILLANLGRVGEFLVGIVKPLISEEVRQKIIVLPRHEKKRREMLQAVVGIHNVPQWLGGNDQYEFDPQLYYSTSIVISDHESTEYIQTMPYHT